MGEAYKAKDLLDNWVVGDLFNASCGVTIIEKGGSSLQEFHFINSKTICERVRGTDFFEGDEVLDPDTNQIGIVKYDCGDRRCWCVEWNSGGASRLKDYFILTGKNIHD